MLHNSIIPELYARLGAMLSEAPTYSQAVAVSGVLIRLNYAVFLYDNGQAEAGPALNLIDIETRPGGSLGRAVQSDLTL